MFLQLDGTFWVQLVNFAIFYAILRVVFLRPVGEAIRKRRAYIDGVQNDFRRFAQQAKDLRREADAKRAAARREAVEVVAQGRAAADAKAHTIAVDYGARAADIAAEARKTVETELRRARSRESEVADMVGKSLLERALGALLP